MAIISLVKKVVIARVGYYIFLLPPAKPSPFPDRFPKRRVKEFCAYPPIEREPQETAVVPPWKQVRVPVSVDGSKRRQDGKPCPENPLLSGSQQCEDDKGIERVKPYLDHDRGQWSVPLEAAFVKGRHEDRNSGKFRRHAIHRDGLRPGQHHGCARSNGAAPQEAENPDNRSKDIHGNYPEKSTDRIRPRRALLSTKAVAMDAVSA